MSADSLFGTNHGVERASLLRGNLVEDKSCNVPRNISIKDLIFHLVKEYALDSVNLEHMILTIAATTSSESIILNNDGKVDEQLASLREKDVLEMLRRPVTISVVFSENGTTPTELRRILVELGSPLNNNFNRFRRCFGQLSNAEYVFQSVVPGEDSQWLNSNKSLRDYGFDASSQRTKQLQLTLVPVPVVTRRWSALQEPIAKKGWLWKQSGSDIDKLSAKRERRFFVLTRTFLAYFKTEADSTPERVIPLDFHLLKRFKAELNPNQVSICLRRVTKYFQVTTKSAMSAVAGINTDGTASEVAGRITSTIVGTLRNVVKPTPNVYLLSTEDQTGDSTFSDWFTALEEKCINTGDRRVFGVDLAESLSRRSRGSLDTSMMIPAVISKTIAALDQKGLEYEGIFRLSGRASTVEMYKDEFDLGEDVDLSTCEDPHSIAALLKTYLRMLPEPLLTFDLYQPFLEAAAKKGLTTEQRAMEVSKVCAQLPLENKLVLRYLLTFFKRVIAQSHVNKMGTNNLAICMGTNLLRSRDADTPAGMSRAITDTSLINEAVQLMIEFESKMNLDVQMGPPPAMTSSSSNPAIPVSTRPTPVLPARGPSPSVSTPPLPPRETSPAVNAGLSSSDPNAAIAAAMRHKLSQAPLPNPAAMAGHSPSVSGPSPKFGTNPFTANGAPPMPSRSKAPSVRESVSAPLPKLPSPSPSPPPPSSSVERATSPPPRKVILPAAPAPRPGPPTQMISSPSDDGQLIASAASIPPWKRTPLYEASVSIRAQQKSNFSQRYCVVTPSSIYVFKSPSEKDFPSRVVPFRDVDLNKINSRTFKLASLVFATNSDAEATEWIQLLVNCIKSVRAAAASPAAQTPLQANEAVEELKWQQASETRRLEKRNLKQQHRIEELERAAASERSRAERLEATLRMAMDRLSSLESRLGSNYQ